MPEPTRKTYRVTTLIWRAINSALAILAIAWFVSIAGVVIFALHDGADPEDNVKADAIVVLGAAQYDGRPSPVLKARIDHALLLWEDSVASLIIFTGGKGRGDTTSEAMVSGEYARKRGIPDQVILLESEGRTTSVSMNAVSSMLHSREMTSVVLVSDPFHMFRLWLTAQRLGLNAVTSPTRTSPISVSRMKNAGYILSESIKAPVAFILG